VRGGGVMSGADASDTVSSFTNTKSSLRHRRDTSRQSQRKEQQQQPLLLQQEQEHVIEDKVPASTDVDDASTLDAERETKIVALFRLLVLVVLLASMASTATAFFVVTRNAELAAFRASFTSDSNDIIESVGETLYTSLGAVDSYLVSLISMARSTNQTWPFVTMPDASVRLAKLRSLSKAVAVQQAHFVTADQKEAWEEYTATNNQWATDGLRVQKTDKNYYGRVYDSFEKVSVIRSYRGNSTGEGPFLPAWHSSPFVPGACISIKSRSQHFVPFLMQCVVCVLHRSGAVQF
jgi:hypothetical protein